MRLVVCCLAICGAVAMGCGAGELESETPNNEDIPLPSEGDGTVPPETVPPEGNEDPPEQISFVVDAGADLEVEEGASVVLEGSIESAPETVKVFWTQESGPSVALDGNATLSAFFVAPEVEQATTLTFRLWAVDPTGSGQSEIKTIVVQGSSDAPAI